MLKTIAEVSPHLIAFILALKLSLSRPQHQHVMQVADALITTEGSKTLSSLYRHIVGNPCPKAAAADTLYPLREFLVQEAFAIAEAKVALCRVFSVSTIA